MSQINTIGDFRAAIYTILSEALITENESDTKALVTIDQGGDTEVSALQDGQPRLTSMPLAVFQPIKVASSPEIGAAQLDYFMTVQLWCKDWSLDKPDKVNSSLLLGLVSRLRGLGFNGDTISVSGPTRRSILNKDGLPGPRVMYSELMISGHACFEIG